MSESIIQPIHPNIFTDQRGKLCIIEGCQTVPFEIKRAFFSYQTNTSALHGGHANRKSAFVVINVSGKCTISITDGKSKETVVLKKPRHMALEVCMEYINDDELVEITPRSIRLRKKILNTDITLGRMTAKMDNVPFNPSSCLTMEYKGMMLVSTGTTIRKRMTKLKNPFPGKLNFERTYPAKPLTITLKTMTIAAYIKLLRAYFQMLYSPKTTP